MAITPRAVGSWAASNATTQTVTLPTHAAGDLLIVRCGQKPYSATPTCATSGWNPVGTQYANGNNANANGAGSVIVRAFYKIATSASETDPVITWNTTSAPGCAVAISYQPDAGYEFIAPTGAGGGDETASTSYSGTISSHITVAAGDLIDFFIVWCDNYAATNPSISQTGVSFGSVTEYPATALSSGTSNDCAADGGYRLASSGTSSAAAVVTATFGNAEEGACWQTRLRQQQITITGTAAGTGAAATGAESGKERMMGTGPVGTGAASTAAIAAKERMTGPLAGAGTASSAALEGEMTEPSPTGTIVATGAASTASLAGAERMLGTVAADGAAATAALEGDEIMTGTVAATGTAATGALEGAELMVGLVAATGQASSAALEGTHTYTGVTGAIAAAGAASTAALTGKLLYTGTIAADGAAAGAALTGSLVVTGSLAASQAAAAATAEGLEFFLAALAGAGAAAGASLDGDVTAGWPVGQVAGTGAAAGGALDGTVVAPPASEHKPGGAPLYAAHVARPAGRRRRVPRPVHGRLAGMIPPASARLNGWAWDNEEWLLLGLEETV